MCEETNRMADLIERNEELFAQFERANNNFWKTINDQRAARRAEMLKSEKAGHDEQRQNQ